MSLNVHPISAFEDNYIWSIYNQQYCVVVDPGDATPVIEYCKNKRLTLVAILITHHHSDHTGGINTLLEAYPDIPVYGPQNPKIQQITHKLKDGDRIELPVLKINLSIMEVPGHTLDHITYYGEGSLFCGDTLFSAGCGRLFEGTPLQMYQSLAKFKALPSKTKVYCTHEYTLANIKFAKAVEPDNQALVEYENWAVQKRTNNLPTLPSTLEKEQNINPFLRCNIETVVASVNDKQAEQLTSEEAVFASLRHWKDNF
ncbi:hydroxyacylglutathione hydrolase [uncultured Paraglaciecola sp.]|uniref:hydroxyacylglutathione hydrolase n=1 Tax=uncultured Paraglaciecola sp. TaxID=1765024 RepID=UPI00259268A6|nr:hydroxyacylglutathione hydrolase [uncultured Paraglaciecola sp.]